MESGVDQGLLVEEACGREAEGVRHVLEAADLDHIALAEPKVLELGGRVPELLDGAAKDLLPIPVIHALGGDQVVEVAEVGSEQAALGIAVAGDEELRLARHVAAPDAEAWGKVRANGKIREKRASTESKASPEFEGSVELVEEGGVLDRVEVEVAGELLAVLAGHEALARALGEVRHLVDHV